MKHIILAALLALTTTLGFARSELEAKSFPALLADIEGTTFTYSETGRMFGFVSTQSCMFKSSELIVFRNYCYPARNFPAQGYTIFSKEYGVIELYEEDKGSVLKRDVRIDQFPKLLAPYLESPLPSLTLADYSLILEKMYPLYLPGCWSTNYSDYTETADANCSKPTDGVVGFAQWSQETQAIVNDDGEWKALMKALDAKFKRR